MSLILLKYIVICYKILCGWDGILSMRVKGFPIPNWTGTTVVPFLHLPMAALC